MSQDGGAFADAAEEVTTVTGSNGTGYVTLTGAETNNSAVAVCFKVASGPKATVMLLSPAVLASVGTGTLSAGSAGGGTLGTLLAYDVTGCFIKTTGGTGGGGTGGASNQARKIVTYNTGSGAFTVTPNWETTPDNTTTYEVLLPEGVTLGMLRALNPTTAGRTLDVSAGGEAGVDWANVGSPTTTLALTGTTIASTQKVDLETIKTQTVTCAGGVTVPAATLASTTNITAGTVTTVSGNVNGSVGSVTGNVGGNVVGSVGSIATGGITSASLAAETGLKPIRSGTLQAAGASSATLDAGASATNDLYAYATLYITGGTGANQYAVITAYDGATKVATTHPAWRTTPDATSTFAVLPRGAVDIHMLNGSDLSADRLQNVADEYATNGYLAANVTAWKGAAPAGLTVDNYVQSHVGTMAADVLTASALAADAVAEIAAAVLTTALTEAYRSAGATGTVAQLLYEIIAHLGESSIAGTTKTLKKLDGTTTAKTYTLDSSTVPTSITETT